MVREKKDPREKGEGGPSADCREGSGVWRKDIREFREGAPDLTKGKRKRGARQIRGKEGEEREGRTDALTVGARTRLIEEEIVGGRVLGGQNRRAMGS